MSWLTGSKVRRRQTRPTACGDHGQAQRGAVPLLDGRVTRQPGYLPVSHLVYPGTRQDFGFKGQLCSLST